jgi:hypothetical protein
MNPYVACASCGCYVKQGDRICPFCGAPNAFRAGGPIQRLPRMSRSQWLACGTTIAVVGCSGDGITTEAPLDATTQTVEAGGAEQAADETTINDARASAPLDANDAAVTLVDANIPESEMAVPLRGEGGFLCERAGGSGAGGVLDADLVCDRANEWCFQNGTAGPVGSRCQSLSAGCAKCIEAFSWDAAAAGDGRVLPCTEGFPRCACLTLSPACTPASGGTCSDDDAGGLTVGCGHCYGAPPARLERLARKSRHASSRDEDRRQRPQDCV